MSLENHITVNSFTKQVFLFICFLIISTIITSCARQTGSEKQKLHSASFDNRYSEALKVANQHAGDDEFDKLFTIVNKILLRNNDIKMLGQVCASQSGQLLVIDNERKTVERFDSEGKFVGVIGNNGNQPGSHLFPSDITNVDKETIAGIGFSRSSGKFVWHK